MKRFKPETYNPTDDSSFHRKAVERSEKDRAVVLLVADGECHCGCGEKTNGKSRFRMGHDARLKGKLIRAHLAKVDVVQGTAGGSAKSALIVAASYGWDGYLLDADLRRRKDATPKVGDRVPYKVGRWTYDAQVTQVEGDSVEVQWTTAKGEVKTKMVPVTNLAA